MLTSVTLGFNGDLTRGDSQWRPMVEFYIDPLAIAPEIKFRILKHGDLDPFSKELLKEMTVGNHKPESLEEVIKFFSSPHTSVQVIRKEYENDNAAAQMQRVKIKLED